MFNTPQKRGAPLPSFNTPSRPRLTKGLFADGIWLCNCDPRLPASSFQVKKEGPNKGRWFYTCQESKESGCGFFLWKDDAFHREMGTVLNNTRSEQDQLRTPTEASRDKRTVEGHSAASNKFIEDLIKAEEEEFGGFPFAADVEREMAKAADQAQMRSPETPRKAIKTSYVATPGSKRKRDEDSLPTPVTRASKSGAGYNALNNDNVFETPKGMLKGEWGGSNRSGLRSPSATPSHFSYREPTEASEDQAERGQQSYDISDEVMELLKDQHIDHETALSLQELLNKHALKISGIAKGRDITRLALKAKDSKIAELQQKITTLETERDMDKTIIRHFKSDMARSLERRRGRSRGRT